MQCLYFIAIIPPIKLSNEIDEIRKQCAKEYEVYSALKPPVHITLIPPFKLEPILEAKLVSTLEQCRDFDIFEQELFNYDGFPPKVVFIRATKNPAITTLYKLLKENTKPYIKKTTVSFNPHITIAYRDVKPIAYKQMMKAYGKCYFKASFMVYKFSLLKHDGKKWNILKEFNSNPSEQQYKIDL